ncbi:hypothetical protein PVAND_016790 [Polypedilum vanderplanki]|uniref:Kazal-like domain-containing protein n=1 Tax=Polypedilum vanderplanki TaxID=319348 RepID=A0A9J6BHD5_POLVA|nr:hypothetical protein PVAND_016790 [Polypedilum vanderplanki]
MTKFSLVTLTFIFTTILTLTNSLSIVKRQIVFPNDDDESSNENPEISDRYARPYYNYPNGNRYHYGFNRHFNPRPNWIRRPQTFIPQFQNQNQISNQNFRPNQNSQFGSSQQNQNFINPQMSTRPSPQVQACIDSCVENTPGQFDPLCSTDNKTYHNFERFNCAVDCGLNVQVMRRGACPRPTIPPWQGRK